jgi:hypothetical protein
VKGCLPQDRFDALAAEALSCAPRAEPDEREGITGHRDGSFAGPAQCRMVGGGLVLEQLMYDKDLLVALRDATGMDRLIPFGAAFVLYEEGDFQGLHTDDVKSTLTVGIALTGNLAPMGWAPHLRARFPDDLAKVVTEHGLCPEGEEFATLIHPYGPGVIQGWAGYDIPHWRPPHADAEPALLATLSYLDL